MLVHVSVCQSDSEAFTGGDRNQKSRNNYKIYKHEVYVQRGVFHSGRSNGLIIRQTCHVTVSEDAGGPALDYKTHLLVDILPVVKCA